MSFLAYGVVGAAMGFLLAASLVRLPRPSATNYHGVRLPAVLGAAVTGGILIVVPLTLAGLTAAGLIDEKRFALALSISVLLVFLAGLTDDLRAARTRGVVRQLGALARGRITSGLVKLVLIVAAAIVFVAIVRPGWGMLRGLIGAAVIAGCANVWNLLDVRPGRSLKYFIPATAALVAAAWDTAYALLGVVAIGAALAVLPYDLRERAMLGDAGSNVLGFVVGVGLFMALSTVGLAVALWAILLLHGVAETVTLSRTIEATPPLRWFDRLGRLPEEPEPARQENQDPVR